MMTEETTAVYLGYAGVAELLGIAPATVRSYRRYGYLPEPDVMIGGLPGWSREAILTWNASRPGPGWWGRPAAEPAPVPEPAPPPVKAAKPTGKRAKLAG